MNSSTMDDHSPTDFEYVPDPCPVTSVAQLQPDKISNK